MPKRQANWLEKLDEDLRDKCINLMLSGKRGALTQVAKLANVTRQAVHDYKRIHLSRAQRLAEIIGTNPGNNHSPATRLSEAAAKLPAVLPILAAREKRLEALQDRHNRMKVVMDERAEEHASVPGGKSGLLVRQVKQIGSGENAQVVEEYRLDTGLLGEFREHEKQLAIELGEWDQGGRPIAGDVVFQNVILMPKTHVRSEPPAQVIDVDSKDVTNE